MSSEHQKVDVESLSSLSIDPNQVAGASNIFGAGRKSSFEYVNILKVSFVLFRIQINCLVRILGTLSTYLPPILIPQNQCKLH